MGANGIKWFSAFLSILRLDSFPQQFTGMKESTYLTRHFAHQGLKIKLRTGGPLAATGKTKKQPSPVPSARSHKKKEKKKGKWMAEEDVKEEVPQDEADSKSYLGCFGCLDLG